MNPETTVSCSVLLLSDFQFLQRSSQFRNTFFKLISGKISLKEFDQTSLENIYAYFDKQVLEKPRMRSQRSQQVWLWHDEDELLQYEGLLEDYHDR